MLEPSKRFLFQFLVGVFFNTISHQTPLLGPLALRFGSLLSSCAPLCFRTLFGTILSYCPHQWPGRIRLRITFAFRFLSSFLNPFRATYLISDPVGSLSVFLFSDSFSKFFQACTSLVTLSCYCVCNLLLHRVFSKRSVSTRRTHP